MRNGRTRCPGPSCPISCIKLGVALRDQFRYDEAASYFRRALALKPGFAEAEMELGYTLFAQGDLDLAVRSLRRAIQLDPANATAHYRLGVALCEQGKVADCIECYRRAIVLKPNSESALMNRAFSMNYDAGSKPAEIFEAHRAWGALHPPRESIGRTYGNDRDPKRRLRIGYVSGDFCDHAANYYFEPLIARHNHREFEVFCYSSLAESAEDEITARTKAHADRWISICHLDDQAAADRIHNDRIDVLIDLGGYTTRSRLAVFAWRPAPVQATWLGYANTSGLTAMDYRITDEIVDPDGTDCYNSEALFRVRAPYLCYRPFPNAPSVCAPPVLKAGHVTFGSFNNLPKLTPEVIGLWARLLRLIPDSRLVIKTVQMRDGPTADGVRAQFASHGIQANRIDLLPWRVWTVHHLARYGLIDIALDPFPYTGVTTTCEALWMGVPVVSLLGDRPTSRVGASLLSAVGLPDLVAEDHESYLRAATRLAHDLTRLKELRSGLRERMQASPLCDEAGFARVMERAYRRMWQVWCNVKTDQTVVIPSRALPAAAGRG